MATAREILNLLRSRGSLASLHDIQVLLDAAGENGNDYIAIDAPSDPAVASSVQAFAVGPGATASGPLSLAIGKDAAASGGSSIAIGRNSEATSGNSMAIGDSCKNIGNTASIAIGTSATIVEASGTSQLAIGNGATSGGVLCIAIGNAQGLVPTGRACLSIANAIFSNRASTTDATPTEGISIPVLQDTAMNFTIMAVGMEDPAGDTHTATIRGAIKNVGGTVTLVGTPDEIVFEDVGAATWSVAATADDTGDALSVEVTGEAAHNIEWKIRVDWTAHALPLT